MFNKDWRGPKGEAVRRANTEITAVIKTKTLELLMEKNPDAIAMRDIAVKPCRACAPIKRN